MNFKFLIIVILLIIFSTPVFARHVDCDKIRRANPTICLACNIYHEARNEPYEGKIMVALVTLERVKDDRFPNDICSVVWDMREWPSYRRVAQFSWTRDGIVDIIRQHKEWRNILKIAKLAILGHNINEFNFQIPGIRHQGVLWYHATYVKPKWAKYRHIVAKIGLHIFYREQPVAIMTELLPKKY